MIYAAVILLNLHIQVPTKPKVRNKSNYNLMFFLSFFYIVSVNLSLPTSPHYYIICTICAYNKYYQHSKLSDNKLMTPQPKKKSEHVYNIYSVKSSLTVQYMYCKHYHFSLILCWTRHQGAIILTTTVLKKFLLSGKIFFNNIKTDKIHCIDHYNKNIQIIYYDPCVLKELSIKYATLLMFLFCFCCLFQCYLIHQQFHTQ